MRILRIKILSAAIIFATTSTLPVISQAGFCSPKANHKQQHPYQKQQARYPTAPRYTNPYARAYYGYKRYPSARYQARGYAYPDYYGRQSKQFRPVYAPSMNRAWKQRQPSNITRYPGPKSSAKPQNKSYKWKSPQNPRQIYIKHKRPPQYSGQAYANRPGYDRTYSGNRRAAYYGYAYPVNKSPARQTYRQMRQPAATQRQAPPYYNWQYAYNQPYAYYRPQQPGQTKALAWPQKLKYSKPATELKYKPALQQISITEKGFQPSQLRVNKGDRVLWANVDIEPHQISSHAGWQSKILTRGATYMHTFNKPGVYKFYSASNPRWYGEVQVR